MPPLTSKWRNLIKVDQRLFDRVVDALTDLPAHGLTGFAQRNIGRVKRHGLIAVEGENQMGTASVEFTAAQEFFERGFTLLRVSYRCTFRKGQPRAWAECKGHTRN